jgi:hypothetical protein
LTSLAKGVYFHLNIPLTLKPTFMASKNHDSSWQEEFSNLINGGSKYSKARKINKRQEAFRTEKRRKAPIIQKILGMLDEEAIARKRAAAA